MTELEKLRCAAGKPRQVGILAGEEGDLADAFIPGAHSISSNEGGVTRGVFMETVGADLPVFLERANADPAAVEVCKPSPFLT